jgi:hypothetical protein
MLGFQGGASIPLVKGGVKAPPAKRQCRAGPKAGARRGFTLTEGLGAAKLTHSQAVRLIELYGDLEAIYLHLSQLTSPHLHKKLTDNEAQARRYYGESQPERRLVLCHVETIG